MPETKGESRYWPMIAMVFHAPLVGRAPYGAADRDTLHAVDSSSLIDQSFSATDDVSVPVVTARCGAPVRLFAVGADPVPWPVDVRSTRSLGYEQCAACRLRRERPRSRLVTKGEADG